MARIDIIGGGAAGCFAAIRIMQKAEAAGIPLPRIVVHEAADRPLKKVAITGGGRCNLTNTFAAIRGLKEAYPRGEKLIKRAFHSFNHEDTFRWFEQQGVRLVVQDDQCIFPQSQDAMEIVNTLVRLMRHYGVVVKTHSRITDIRDLQYDFCIVTTGGSPRTEGLQFLAPLNLEIAEPVPSLFTFNINDQRLQQLMGTVVNRVSVMLAGTKFKATDTLLITHWGVSGPAILKLSSYAARHLAECGYKANLVINWMDQKETEVADLLRTIAETCPNRLVTTEHPHQFTSRHWSYILERCAVKHESRWRDLGSKQLSRMASILTADTYPISGKNRYKEEFVTCGGVALSNLNPNTLECKSHPNIYFAGEVTDVDAITGGFNLQAAWSMAETVANSIVEKIHNS